MIYKHSRARKYEGELQMCRLEVSAVDFSDYHPLKAITVTDSKARRSGRKGSTSSSSSSSSSVALDPLSSMLDGTDPLSLFAAASETPTLPHSISLGRKRREKEEEVGSDFEPWSSKRGEILSRFTTTEKLSINLFMGSDKSKASSPSSAVSEKVRTRLEELDDLEEGSQRELLNLSQQDYVNRIEELNQSLKEAWGSDQKVKALKIVIQCSKLLSDTSVIQFYPSKFVLISSLVYDRIWSICADPHPLPESFSADDVNDTAKETCLNWFFKIASIRELVPRLYVEAALLKCNRFLTKSGIQETLQRLTAMIRGIGDPLVAVYARAYLCRVGMEVAPHLKDSLNKNFFDLLASFRQIHGESVQNQLVQQRVEIPIYLTLYSPAIHWILQCVAYRAPEDYINCAEIWVEFTCRHFTKREVNTVLTVNQLAMETRCVMKGNHSRKTASFVRACAAYSFITIPSLTSIFSRLNLYLLSGQVALANQCLSQADAFLKAAVSLLPEVPRTISIEGKQRSSEPFLLDFINNFLSTLLVVPDHPEQGVLYLVRGLLNMVQDYTWEDNSDAKIRVYISALPLLAAMSQESYLYTIPKVDSNETLYGGDPKFIAEINKLCETLIAQVLDHLKGLGRDEGVRRQGSLAFSLFGCLLAHGDLRNNKLNQLAVNLWNLSHKHGFCDTRTSVRTLEYIKHQAQLADLSHLSDMTARLSLQSRA
uniref:VPS35 endosomal protein-sorting factor-like n=1 Tax=Sinocyclocheilus grahami TaxID=75366 RepID=A0A672K2V9_SINGR